MSAVRGSRRGGCP